MATLQSTNVVGTLCVNGVAIGGGKDYKYCCISGSGNFTPPSALVDGNGAARVVLAAGGGGGGGGIYCFQNCQSSYPHYLISKAPGGGGGAVADVTAILSSTDNCCVVIGAGGTGAEGHSVAPTEGGNSCFGNVLAIAGGGAGEYSNILYCRHTNSTNIQSSCDGLNTRNGATMVGQYSGCLYWGNVYGGGAAIPPYASTSDGDDLDPTRVAGACGISKGMATISASERTGSLRYDMYGDVKFNLVNTGEQNSKGGNPGIKIDYLSAGTGGNSIALGNTSFCDFRFIYDSLANGCIFSGSDSGFTPPSTFYGTGGSSDFSMCYCNCRSGGSVCCFGFKGGDGTDGLAVIKWSE